MAKLTSMHFYAWKKGLKTGMYYLRTKAAADAIKFTVQTQAEPAMTPVLNAQPEIKQVELHAAGMVEMNQGMSDISCSLDNPEACEACGS